MDNLHVDVTLYGYTHSVRDEVTNDVLASSGGAGASCRDFPSLAGILGRGFEVSYITCRCLAVNVVSISANLVLSRAK